MTRAFLPGSCPAAPTPPLFEPPAVSEPDSVRAVPRELLPGSSSCFTLPLVLPFITSPRTSQFSAIPQRAAPFPAPLQLSSRGPQRAPHGDTTNRVLHLEKGLPKEELGAVWHNLNYSYLFHFTLASFYCSRQRANREKPSLSPSNAHSTFRECTGRPAPHQEMADLSEAESTAFHFWRFQTPSHPPPDPPALPHVQKPNERTLQQLRQEELVQEELAHCWVWMWNQAPGVRRPTVLFPQQHSACSKHPVCFSQHPQPSPHLSFRQPHRWCHHIQEGLCITLL